MNKCSYCKKECLTDIVPDFIPTYGGTERWRLAQEEAHVVYELSQCCSASVEYQDED